MRSVISVNRLLLVSTRLLVAKIVTVICTVWRMGICNAICPAVSASELVITFGRFLEASMINSSKFTGTIVFSSSLCALQM